MVQDIINKEKSQAKSQIVNKYNQTSLEPELRPEYKAKINQIIKGRHFSRSSLL